MRCKKRLSGLICLAAVAIVFTVPAWSGVWDLAADFDTVNNPGPIWGYGYTDASTGTPEFSPLLSVQTEDYSPYFTGVGSGWESPYASWKGMVKCTGVTAYDVPIGRCGGHAETGARWTAPGDSSVVYTVDLVGGFWQWQNYGDGRTVQVTLGLVQSGVASTLFHSVTIPTRVQGCNSSNTFSFIDAIVKGGGTLSQLNGISVSGGDSIYVNVDGYDLTGIDFAIVEPGTGTPGTISGVVTGLATGTPIVGATVSLVGTASSTTTASDGAYTLSGVLPSNYVLQVSAPGYVAKTANVSLCPGTTVVRDASLEKAAPGIWDLAADFDTETNPGAIWGYGVTDVSSGLTWNPLFTPKVVGYVGVGDGWIDPNATWRGMVKATTASGYDAPIGRCGGHSPTGARWTAPCDATVSLSGAFWPWQDYGDGRVVHATLGLVRGGVASTLFSNVLVPPRTQGCNSGNKFSFADAIVAGGGSAGQLNNISVSTGDCIYVNIGDYDYYGLDFSVVDVSTLGTPISPGAAKALGPGEWGIVEGIVTSAVPDDGFNWFTVEALDRSSAMKAAPLGDVAVGDKVQVLGQVTTDGAFAPSLTTVISHDNVCKPLGMNNKSVEDSNLLVTSWGRVLDTPAVCSDGSTRFHITDGTAIEGGPTVNVPYAGSTNLFTDTFAGTTINPAWDFFGNAVEVDEVLYTDGYEIGAVTGEGMSVKDVKLEVDAGLNDWVGFVFRFKDTNNFLMASYAKNAGGLFFEERVDGAWGPWLPGYMGVTITGTRLHLTGQVVGNTGTLTLSSDVPGESYTVTSTIPTFSDAGLFGVYYQLQVIGGWQEWDNFTATSFSVLRNTLADSVQVVIPASVDGTPTIDQGDYVRVTGIADAGLTTDGTVNPLRAVVVTNADGLSSFR